MSSSNARERPDRPMPTFPQERELRTSEPEIDIEGRMVAALVMRGLN